MSAPFTQNSGHALRAEIEILDFNPEILNLDYATLCNTALSIIQ